jgi:regulator of sigma E protease
METLLAFLIFIGILVLVHEFGHFIVAKAFGVKVEVFSIGFGPPIFQKKWGETVYQIAVLPLGGYVKLYGEEDSEEVRKDPRSFYAKPPWQRILIAFAGPLFNFLFAILTFWIVFLQPKQVPQYIFQPPKVGYVEHNSPAEKIGLKLEDVIVAVNGKPVKNWKDLSKLLEEYAGKEVTLKVLRNGKEITLKVKLDYKVLSKGIGILPYIPPVVGDVEPGSPAAQVGLKKGDRIVEINGKPVHSWWNIVFALKETGGKPLNLKVERNGKIITLTVVPKYDPTLKRYILGIKAPIEYEEVRLSPLEALKRAIDRTWFLTVLTVKVIWGLITGAVSVKTLGGPLAIAGFAGEAAKLGLIAFLSAMATLSVQLGLFNLIPLPLLDGGLILLFLIEWIRGKPLSEKFKEWWVKIGFVIIVSLMVFIFTQDIIRFLTTGKLMPTP